MLRRDRHVALVLGAMLFLNVLTALLAVSATYIYRRRFKALSEDVAVSVKTSEKASIDAASAALTLMDAVRSGATSDGDAVDAVPVVLGYGQTRSRGAHYIYRDVRYGDEVRREFVQRIPFKAR